MPQCRGNSKSTSCSTTYRHTRPHGATVARQAPALSPAFHADERVLAQPVERFFAELTQKQIRRGTHRSTQDLVSAIENYISIRNENPRPFIWTKSADEMFASITRFCLRTSDPGH